MRGFIQLTEFSISSLVGEGPLTFATQAIAKIEPADIRGNICTSVTLMIGNGKSYLVAEQYDEVLARLEEAVAI